MTISRLGGGGVRTTTALDLETPLDHTRVRLRGELSIHDVPLDPSWSTWTELPRFNNASTTSTWFGTDRAVFAVVMGTTTVLSGAALAAPADVSSTEAMTRDALFTLGVTKTVGVGGANVASDVSKVQTALAARGFDVDVDGQWGKGTERALRVFEAMLTGQESVASTSGKLTPGGRLDLALASNGGPRWVEMPKDGVGFTRVDHDGFSHGSSMAADTISRAGARYAASHLTVDSGATLISVNDVSTRHGGHNADHVSHQAGLDIDLSLPTKTGGHSTVVGSASYDREATFQMIAAFAADPQVERILFTDAVLLKRISESSFPWKSKVRDGGPDHRNHIHVDVGPFRAPR